MLDMEHLVIEHLVSQACPAATMLGKRLYVKVSDMICLAIEILEENVGWLIGVCSFNLLSTCPGQEAAWLSGENK